jgi:hypothetical protein
MEHYGDYPAEKWYHENILRIYSDSIEIDKSPIVIRGKDTTHSASDGAFYYYKGKIEKENNQLYARLKLVTCDYCAVPAKKVGNAYEIDSTFYAFKKYSIKIVENKIILDNIEYIKKQ